MTERNQGLGSDLRERIISTEVLSATADGKPIIIVSNTNWRELSIADGSLQKNGETAEETIKKK